MTEPTKETLYAVGYLGLLRMLIILLSLCGGGAA